MEQRGDQTDPNTCPIQTFVFLQKNDTAVEVESAYWLSVDGKFIHVLQHFLDLLGGYSASEMVGHAIYDFLHPDDLNCTAECLDRVIENKGLLLSLAYRMKCKNGSWLWINSISFAKSNDDTCQVEAIVCSAQPDYATQLPVYQTGGYPDMLPAPNTQDGAGPSVHSLPFPPPQSLTEMMQGMHLREDGASGIGHVPRQ